MKTDCLLVALVFASPVVANAQSADPFHFVQTISLPNVKGRIDHLDVDVKGKRLFVAGLENGSVEVVDLQAGRWRESRPGVLEAQGVAHVAALKKLFCGGRGDGEGGGFRGRSLGRAGGRKVGCGAKSRGSGRG